jgi:hypothetical protein
MKLILKVTDLETVEPEVIAALQKAAVECLPVDDFWRERAAKLLMDVLGDKAYSVYCGGRHIALHAPVTAKQIEKGRTIGCRVAAIVERPGIQ